MSPALFTISLFGIIINAVGGACMWRGGHKREGVWLLGVAGFMVALFVWELG